MEIEIPKLSSDKSTQKFYTLNGTPQSSTTQLTDPPLYSIYGGRNNIFDENQEEDSNLYTELSEKVVNKKEECVADDKTKQSPILILVTYAMKVFIFGQSICYLFDSVHQSHPNIIPFYSSIQLGNINSFFKITLEVVVLNCLIFTILHFLNAQQIQFRLRSTIQSTSILQLCVAIIGIVYSFKKLQWSSTLQADLIFIIENISLFTYVGASFNEFVATFSISIASLAYNYLALNENFDISLWRASFSFLSAIIFITLKKSNRFL